MSLPPSINLDYRTAPARPRARPAYLVSRLITSYLGYGLIMVVLAVIVPRFERVYADFQVRLPALTALLLAASRFCLRYYLWATLIPLPAIWSVANTWIPSSRDRRRMRLAAFVGVILFLVLTLFALFTPMASLASTTATSPPPPATSTRD